MDNFKPEQFNPKDEKYKEVKDLPEEQRGDFVEVPEERGGGFVKKEAAETLVDAKREANINIGKGRLNEVTPQDVLHEKAAVDQDFINKVIEKAKVDGKFEGIKERVAGDYSSFTISKSFSSSVHSSHDVGHMERDTKEIDVTNNLFKEGLINKGFFLELAYNKVKIDPKVIPEELCNDEDFILNLVKENPRQVVPLSERLSRDEDFILKLAEQGIALSQIGFRSGNTQQDRNGLYVGYSGESMFDSAKRDKNFDFLTKEEFLKKWVEHFVLDDSNYWDVEEQMQEIIENRELMRALVLKNIQFLIDNKSFVNKRDGIYEIYTQGKNFNFFVKAIAEKDSNVEEALNKRKAELIRVQEEHTEEEKWKRRMEDLHSLS